MLLATNCEEGVGGLPTFFLCCGFLQNGSYHAAATRMQARYCVLYIIWSVKLPLYQRPCAAYTYLAKLYLTVAV